MDDDYLTYQFDQLNRQAAIDEAVEAYKRKLIKRLKKGIKETKNQWGYRSEHTEGQIDGLDMALELITG